MLKVVKELLLKIVNDLDTGNTNISTEESIELVKVLQYYTDPDRRMSKYAACKYLNVSRATFDNYIREGKLPKRKHEIGFKELSWSRRDLDKFIKERRSKKC